MKPGDLSTFTKGDGNAVVMAVGLWAARDGIHLRIDMSGDGPHEAVTNGPDSARNHPILFRDLQKMLEANGCWAPGDEDAKAPSSESAEN